MKIGVNHFYYGYFLFTYTLYVILVKNAIDMVKNVYYRPIVFLHLGLIKSLVIELYKDNKRLFI